MDVKNSLRCVTAVLPAWLTELIGGIDSSLLAELEEIRLRRCRPVNLCIKGKNLFLGDNGSLSVFQNGAVVLSAHEIEEAYLKLCRNSVYSFQKDIANGFITLDGGHRAGICGSAVIDCDAVVIGLRDISTINIRIARQVIGCALEAHRAVFDAGNIESALIISPPKCGKTTMLRDLARFISSEGKRVCIIDERSEIAAVHDGVPSCDVGPCTDVYNGIAKHEGITRALRTMSPEVIICDEIGSEKDAESILGALNCGVPVIATAHASTLEELLRREGMRRLVGSGAFCKAIILNNKFKVEKIEQLKETVHYECKISGGGGAVPACDRDRYAVL